MKAIIVAGGHGSRLLPLTNHTHKTLLPLCGHPIIDYALATIRNAGITEITIIGNRFIEKIRNHVGENVNYVLEMEPKGVATALQLARKGNENCSLLITISGTAALEAAFLQKPSITFIDSDYTKIDSIERVKSIEELPKMIRKSIKKKITPEDLDRYVTLKENNVFDYDDREFSDSYLNKFYLGGQTTDVNIVNEDMTEFLKESEKKLEEFTNQHIKKIEYLKKLN